MFRQKLLADPKASFAFKNVLITGANTGLGFEAASKFAALGASKVILGCRDEAKGKVAKSIIDQRTGKGDKLHVWPLDMNSYESIQAFARRASSLDHLDVAVLNAGVFKVDYKQSPYRWEETLQVNVISTLLLGLLLLPKLRSSKTSTSQSVLEFVSSRRAEKITFNEFQLLHANLLKSFNDRSEFKPGQQYQLSKLFLFCLTERLAQVVTKYSESAHQPDVIVTSVCPGFCQSNLSRGHTGIVATALRAVLNATLLRTTEEGSRTLVSGAALGKEAHGQLWYDDKIGPYV
jgi:NAD(P)-dependent dehydrogenase (short-subunit alcohol dehydrogenase family)